MSDATHNEIHPGEIHPGVDRITPENAALILIDYQTGLMLGTRSIDQRTLRNNAVALTKFGTVFNLPVIYTGDDESTPLGPYMPRSRPRCRPMR